MITYNENTKIFKLDTKTTSYVLGLAEDKYVGHVYYGKKLGSTDLGYLLRLEEPPFVPSKNLREKVTVLDTCPMEYSFSGSGDFRESCITATTAEGQQGLDLTYVSHRIYTGKEALDSLPATWGADSETLEITMEDEPTGIRVLLSYSVFADSDAVIRSVKVINGGKEAVYLDRVMSACLDMDNENYDVLSLHGS